MRLIFCAAVTVTSSASFGCHEAASTPPSVPIVVSVEADPGVYLSGVPVRVDGELLGRSDSDGQLRTELRGHAGRLFRLEHDCPEGHKALQDTAELRLRRYADSRRAPPIEVKLTCRPEARLAVFVVRAANGPDLPVLLNGEVVARTNETGVAHFSELVPAGTEMLVQLDAREHPSLHPNTSSHLVTLPDFDELFLITRSFEKTGKSGQAPRRARPRIIKIE